MIFIWSLLLSQLLCYWEAISALLFFELGKGGEKETGENYFLGRKITKNLRWLWGKTKTRVWIAFIVSEWLIKYVYTCSYSILHFHIFPFWFIFYAQNKAHLLFVIIFIDISRSICFLASPQDAVGDSEHPPQWWFLDCVLQTPWFLDGTVRQRRLSEQDSAFPAPLPNFQGNWKGNSFLSFRILCSNQKILLEERTLFLRNKQNPLVTIDLLCLLPWILELL